MSTFTYNPPTTIRAFMLSDQRVRIVRGPVGSGKSSGMVMELLRRAGQQAPDPKDGIRRSRFALIRNTYPQLKNTTLKTIQELLRGLARYSPTDHCVYIKTGDIESEWLLTPLDTPDDVERLLSLDLTGAWMSELRELPVKLLEDVLGRCGRFPSMMHGGPTWHGVIGETNSFTEDSEWNKVLELKQLGDKPLPASWGYWIQPGARTQEAENKENLVPGYYEELIENNSALWVDQYVDNNIGPSLSGEAVYRASFKKTFHVSKEILQPIPGMLVVVGVDFGRHPAAVITQGDPRGRILTLDECYGDNMGIEQFLDTVLRPLLSLPKYARLPIGLCGDPSGVAKSQIGEESVFQVLSRKGYSAQPAQTNAIDPRLRAVEKWLLQQRDGGAALLISPSCERLILAYQARYRFAKKKDGELQPLPEKKHPWSDLADAHQYAMLGHSRQITGRFMRIRAGSQQPRSVNPAAWT